MHLMQAVNDSKMYLPFREYHILNILEGFEQQTLPLDAFISNYFRAHKALGSKDRGAIAEALYAITRWKGLLDFLTGSSATWKTRFDLFSSPSFHLSKERQDIPTHIRVSFPKELFDQFVLSHGLEKACELCSICNAPAPTTVRVNAFKKDREELLSRWKLHYAVRPTAFAPHGIIFDRKINFFELPEFKQGLFEVQDEGSQLLAKLVEAKPGELVMDYCAGAGGKALAIAPSMQNKGQLFLHDIRKHALLDARKRLRRAGIQNAQIIFDDEAKLKKLKRRMDWVLVDAPCSGTGTLRRNPDMKWKYSNELLERLVGQQRTIFERALSFLKPNGYIVYATCSLLKQENADQIEHFIKTYDLIQIGSAFESLPSPNGMDGFFGAVLKRKA